MEKRIFIPKELFVEITSAENGMTIIYEEPDNTEKNDFKVGDVVASRDYIAIFLKYDLDGTFTGIFIHADGVNYSDFKSTSGFVSKYFTKADLQSEKVINAIKRFQIHNIETCCSVYDFKENTYKSVK